MTRFAGTITLRKDRRGVLLVVHGRRLETGLMLPSSFGIRSVHFGTKLRGYDLSKGQGYGWDGRDYIRARKQGTGWILRIPLRDDDPKRLGRRFVKGNLYIRTQHNEIIYFNLHKWRFDPARAGKTGKVIEIDFAHVPNAERLKRRSAA